MHAENDIFSKQIGQCNCKKARGDITSRFLHPLIFSTGVPSPCNIVYVAYCDPFFITIFYNQTMKEIDVFFSINDDIYDCRWELYESGSFQVHVWQWFFLDVVFRSAGKPAAPDFVV